MIGSAGTILLSSCISKEDTVDRSRIFSDFTIINKTDNLARPLITIQRNGEVVFDRAVAVSPSDPKQLIDKVDPRNGVFEVSVDWSGDQEEIPVTQRAEGEKYSLAIVIEGSAIIPLVSDE